MGSLKHRIPISIGALTCAAAFIVAAPRAQLVDMEGAEFEASAVSVRSADHPDRGRLDLYVQVPIHKLGFEGTPRGFKATYTVKAEFSRLNEHGHVQSVIQSPIWEQSVVRDFHADTIDKTATDLTTHAVTLHPGPYMIAIQYKDKLSRQAFFKEILAEVRDFSRPLTLSDLVVLESLDSETQEVTPCVAGALSSSAADMELYYLVYAHRAGMVTLTQEMMPAGQWQGARTDSATHYAWTDTLSVGVGQHHQVSTIPVGQFEAGQYRVKITLRDDLGHLRDTAERTVTLRWDGLEHYTQNLDEAIDQLKYVARGRELRALNRANNEEERLRLFMEFWDKRDPTPGTARNERMEEHYYRIDYSNRKFRRHVPGWKTDRGLVYVLHGHPDDVNRQTYSYSNKPWEVWYFYRIGRQFIFVDKTGFGDYDLIYPVWDDRNRID